MIYIIDEDEVQMGPLMLEMRLRAIDAKQLANADDAMRHVSAFTPEDFLIVDVMLAVDADEASSAFSRDETDDYKITGLVLVSHLLKARPDLPPSRIVLTSQASSPQMRSRISQFALINRVHFIPKGAYDDPVSFGDALERLIDGVEVK